VLFIEFRGFTERLHRLAKGEADLVLRAIQGDLLANPSRGIVIPGLAGIRKARAGNPSRGKGKRGGFRYLYYFLERDDEIYLLFLLDKDEQEDLNESRKPPYEPWLRN
jgi:mRNA-degrading endonuclease RelE of RelBE toxin-antitoxin system